MNNEEKILYVMKNIEGEISVSELAEIAEINLSHISKYWKKLEKDGLLKSRVVQDGRKRYIYLSNKKLPLPKKLGVVGIAPSKVGSGQSNSQETQKPKGVESKKDFDEIQVEKVKKLMKIISPTTITLETWIKGQLKRYKLVPAIESFEKVFPQMTKEEITLFSSYYRAQGYSQRETPFDEIGLIRPIK